MPLAGEEATAPFFDADGRLRAMPRRWGVRRQVLARLARAFEAGRAYREAEVNAALAAASGWGDPATLRRELVDAGLLSREADGSAYRLSDGAARQGLGDPGA